MGLTVFAEGRRFTQDEHGVLSEFGEAFSGLYYLRTNKSIYG